MGSPTKTTPIHVAAVACLLLSAMATYLFSYRPVVRSRAELAAALEEQTRLNQQSADMRRDTVRLTASIQETQGRLAARYNLGTLADQPLLETVSELLNERAIELVNLRSQRMPDLGREVIDLQIKGRYPMLVRLLADLRRLDRPAHIQALQLTPSDETGEVCNAQMKVEFSPRALVAHNEGGS